MATTAPTPISSPRLGWSSLLDLSRYQWFVFSVAAIAWMADCMDQQLFNLARQTAAVELVGSRGEAAVTSFRSWSTAIFLVGWAVGGLIFGMFGDRIGRVRTLTLTILLYSVFTGLSALSQGAWDFYLYRFLTGLGVGGVFSAAVALLAETMPPNARPFTLGLMQASSAIGNCTAAGLFILLGLMELNGQLVRISAWRIMFLVGLVPALLVIFIQRRLEEPASWKQARDDAASGVGKKLGSYAELFQGGWITRHAILGLILSFAGVVALWGIVFFAIDLQQKIFAPIFLHEANQLGLTGTDMTNYVKGQGIIWAGVTSFMLNVGAFLGMSWFSWFTQRVGRRPAFAVTFLLAGLSTGSLFWFMKTRTDIMWMTPLMGFFTLALFGGYAIYLPELFPTRLRATGTSFCYNVGRFVAATGPLTLGFLTNHVFSQEKGFAEPQRYAGLAMCSIFLLGIAVLPFLPETKDQPLPE
jgi:MFS family permease